jgi:hypothetical protein
MRIQELTFVDENKTKENGKQQQKIVEKVTRTVEDCIRTPESSRLNFEVYDERADDQLDRGGLLCELFDEGNTTVTSHNSTVLSPRRHKVYVADTPVELQGCSLRQRRRNGFHY